MTNPRKTLSCRCGEVSLEVQGAPIISAECLCSDCQTAGGFLEALPAAPTTLNENGATRFVLYRKDLIECKKGSEHLREYRLSNEATTRRVVAACCNTPVFLEFAGGHWLSIYGGLWLPSDLPALEVRTMTRSRRSDVVLPNDVPNPQTHTVLFYWRLFAAWVAMGFRTPKVDYVSGELNAK